MASSEAAAFIQIRDSFCCEIATGQMKKMTWTNAYHSQEQGDKEQEEEIKHDMRLGRCRQTGKRNWLHLKKKRRRTYIACAEGDVDKQKNELIAQEEEEEEEEDVHSMR